jgi:hypothetical protein
MILCAVSFTMILCRSFAMQCTHLCSDCIIPGEESEEELLKLQRGIALLQSKEFRSRLEAQDSFGLDSPSFQKLFQGGGDNLSGVGGGEEDDESVFSDIQLNGDNVVHLLDSTKPSQVGKKSSSTKRDKKQNKKKSKGSKKPEDDTSRPNSDRKAFERLQEAKSQYRKLKNHHPVGKHYSTETAIMPATTRNKNALEVACGLEAGDADIGKVPRKKTTKTSSNRRDGGENMHPNGQAESELGHALSPKPGGKRKDPPEETPNDNEDTAMREEIEEIMKIENKLPLNKRGIRIQQLHEKMYDLKARLHDMAQLATKYGRQKDKMRKTIDDLQKKLLQSDTVSQDSAALLRLNNELLKACKEIAKSKLWRSRKFIADHDDENQAAEFVLNYLNVPEMKTKETKASMIKTYKTQIKKTLYAHKSYVASEFKKVAFKMLKDKKKLPNSEDILKCITRNIVSVDDMELFEWYWEILLPKMIGAKEWDTSVRYYTTISLARDAENEKERLVSISDEAMCLLLWENSHDRWLVEYAWEEDPSNAGQKKPKWDGKFTNSKLGQQLWGGWKLEGYQAFNQYYTLTKTARNNANCIKVEKTCLQNLRMKNKITEKNRDLQEYQNRRIKRAEKKGETLEVGLPIPLQHQSVRPVTEEEEDRNEGEDEIMDEE